MIRVRSSACQRDHRAGASCRRWNGLTYAQFVQHQRPHLEYDGSASDDARGPRSPRATAGAPAGAVPGRNQIMPLFMDVHHRADVGLTPDQLGAIHARDLAVQGKYGVQYIKYWYDEATGKAF